MMRFWRMSKSTTKRALEKGLSGGVFPQAHDCGNSCLDKGSEASGATERANRDADSWQGRRSIIPGTLQVDLFGRGKIPITGLERLMCSRPSRSRRKAYKVNPECDAPLRVGAQCVRT